MKMTYLLSRENVVTEPYAAHGTLADSLAELPIAECSSRLGPRSADLRRQFGALGRKIKGRRIGVDGAACRRRRRPWKLWWLHAAGGGGGGNGGGGRRRVRFPAGGAGGRVEGPAVGGRRGRGVSRGDDGRVHSGLAVAIDIDDRGRREAGEVVTEAARLWDCHPWGRFLPVLLPHPADQTTITHSNANQTWNLPSFIFDFRL